MKNLDYLCPLESIQRFAKKPLYPGKNFKDLYELISHIQLPKQVETLALSFADPFLNLAFILRAWSQGIKVISLGHKEVPSQWDNIQKNIAVDLLIGENYADDDELVLNYNQFISKQISTPKAINPNQAALLINTSGSSANNKLITLSPANIFYSAMGTIEFYQLVANDKWFLNLPLNHVGGLMITLRCLYCGSSFQTSWQGSNLVSLVPTQLWRLLEAQDSIEQMQAMKVILLGGAACPQTLLKKIQKYDLPVSITYGLTEACSQLSATLVEQIQTLNGHVGTALPYREIKIKDDKILFRGANLFVGHYSDNQFFPTKTDEQGFFTTQDLGQMQQGNLYHCGRADNVLISGGENINLTQVKQSIDQLEYIEDSYLLGVEHEEFGQVIAAFVKFHSQAFDAAQLKMDLKNQLRAFQIPKYFFDLSLLKLKSLKVTKNDLKQFAKNQGLKC